jgi:hypothetical protein
MVGFQITLPANAHINTFGAIKATPDDSAQFNMALYTNSGSNLPETRVAHTATAAFASTTFSLQATNDSTACLAAGTYWLIAQADNALVMRQATSGSVTSISAPGSGLPATWSAGGTTSSAPELNMYVTFDHP